MPPRQRLILILLIPLTALAIALLGALLIQPAQTAPDDFYVTNNAYLSAANAQWLALVALLPLGITLGFVWQYEEPVVNFFQPEMIGAYGWWITLANAYAVAYSLRLARMLPAFEPELLSLNDSRLPQAPINVLAVTLVAGTILFFGWFIFGRKFGFGRMADRIVLPHRRAALLILLAAVAVTVWLFGGLNFALLMIPPAWLWILIEPRATVMGKAINATLAVGGVAAFGAMYLFLPNGLNLWHLVLAAAYGLFFPLNVMMFLLLVALGIRFLRLGLFAPYAPPSDRHEVSSETLRV
ncbi:MAG TPA: hypothetical protein VJ020_03385 [Anaerolineales bacterium]|nr:hypothetical protein [Anaerolineales bacterium]